MSFFVGDKVSFMLDEQVNALKNSNGDPAPRMVGGYPYFFCVKCETCNGAGEIGRWPKESAAPSTQGRKRSGRTAQRGGHFSGGDA